MKNVLILASGEIAKEFVHRVSESRINENYYYISFAKESLSDKHCFSHITCLDIDPTSYMRLKDVMLDREFRTVFIVMDNKMEAFYTLQNVRVLNPELLIIFVNSWRDELDLDLDSDNITIIDSNEILASNLYEKLPNVPLIATNIGVGQGEIMEVLVPFGSSFAFRHVGSISHKKWRVVAIYRDEEQILPNPKTMIKPYDRLIVMGNPIVLERVYKKINRRQGVFPEPFGSNLYLILDSEVKKEDILLQINEAVYLSNQLSRTKLYVRLIDINDFDLIKELRLFENDNVSLLLSYKDDEVFDDINNDIKQLDIGLFLLDKRLFFKKNFKEYLYDLSRPVYIFGDKSIYNIKESLILIDNSLQMESLSSSVFDFSENLGLSLSLCDYNPDGDFEDSRNIIQHYEALSRLYNFKISIKRKRVNPVRELVKHKEVLHISPFSKNIRDTSLISFLSIEMSYFFLSIKKHPQLLIPIDN